MRPQTCNLNPVWRHIRKQSTHLSKTTTQYVPQDPLQYPSQRHIIQSRIDQINDQIKQQELKSLEKKKKQEKEDSKVRISDFSRPLLNTFLLASLVYFGLQYAWWDLEREKIIQDNEILVSKLERDIQLLVDEHLDSQRKDNKKSWYRFW
ncbi:BA75_04977T0 [Komagataella pastoris]|uniref:BA75_04977T0 n=1 Tax=Komagataella pastoris TaxID=4922 RepID=A0A1B2JI99_PICPA|nr:BA75_04977T0 [Komagataella pastoris]